MSTLRNPPQYSQPVVNPQSQQRKIVTQQARRVVVKIGTGVLTDQDGLFDRQRFASLCEELRDVAAARELVVVSSGAIALGVERLGLKARPRDIQGKQAAAAVGQSRLMRLYDDHLATPERPVAQILLTHADIQSRTRYLNARHAIGRLIERRAIPIINENDTVSVEELKFGDNDALAGMCVDLVEADLLVILTDTDGVFTADPRVNPEAVRISQLEGVDDAALALAGGARSRVGTGGMLTKLKAAQRTNLSGVSALIAPGKRVGVLAQLLTGEDVGTFVLAPRQKESGKKRWIARDLAPKGQLLVDEGAVDALVRQCKSLLPSGIRSVSGHFVEGDAVEVLSLDGQAVARGLVRYASDDLQKIAGHHSSEIDKILGFRYLDEAVHRDDLVVLDTAKEKWLAG